MTIYVDDLELWPGAKYKTCHMATDSDLDELHQFAHKIGLKKEWFQVHKKLSHYDLTSTKRKLAVLNGAKQVTAKELFTICSHRTS